MQTGIYNEGVVYVSIMFQLIPFYLFSCITKNHLDVTIDLSDITDQVKALYQSYHLHLWVHLCVYFCTPAYVFYNNHEVVMFQHRTGTSPYLGSVTKYNFFLFLLPHLSLPFFWIFLLDPPSYRPPIRIQSSSNFSLIFTCSPPSLLEQAVAHLYIACTRHLPASVACICAPQQEWWPCR